MSTRPVSASAAAAIALAATATAGVAGWRAAGGGGVDVPWAPSWDLRLAFELDGLAALYALLAAGIGLLVFVYASAYMPRHLARQDRPRAEEARLHWAMALFLASMVGLATAQDLVLLFVFWDLTAVASWLLIGFDRASRHARLSALMALLVTAVSAVLMLVGILVLRAEYGTARIGELLDRAEPGPATSLALALIVVAALAKSAQVPLHFWLPRAMAAPTPVSAYLHSAAMVAAGVFVLSRLHPLLALDRILLDALLAVGLASLVVGGVLALAADGLKRLLAYSTVAQYGYVVAMLGVGGEAGAAAACFAVVAHAIAKSALFMAAGAVTDATGAKRLSELGGMAGRLPLLAAGSAAAAATIAALPLTVGFFKDELVFKAAAGRGPWLAAAVVAGAAVTFAYMARFWTGVFLGPARADVRALPRRLVWPVALLGALAIAGGAVVAPFAALARDAAVATHAGGVALEPAYHADARVENLMALAAYAAGLLLLWGRRHLRGALDAVERAGNLAGPERAYAVALRNVNRLSDRLHDLEVRDLRSRVAAVIVPGAVLVTAGVLVTPTVGSYRAGELPVADAPLAIALAVCAVAALAVSAPRRHLDLVLVLAGVGFALASAFALMGAPDVALVAVLVETVFALLFAGVLALVDPALLREEARVRLPRARRVRDAIIATGSGAVTTLVVWAALSRPVPATRSERRQLALVEEAHGADAVTVVLADFRGLDTLVEVTVVAVAMLVVATLVRGRLRR